MKEYKKPCVLASHNRQNLIPLAAAAIGPLVTIAAESAAAAGAAFAVGIASGLIQRGGESDDFTRVPALKPVIV